MVTWPACWTMVRVSRDTTATARAPAAPGGGTPFLPRLILAQPRGQVRVERPGSLQVRPLGLGAARRQRRYGEQHRTATPGDAGDAGDAENAGDTGDTGDAGDASQAGDAEPFSRPTAMGSSSHARIL